MAHEGGLRMYHIKNPNDMSPEERFHEIAVILSKGYIRLRQKEIMELPGTNANSDNSLDSQPHQSAHGHRS